jgi:predicted small secreted protein
MKVTMVMRKPLAISAAALLALSLAACNASTSTNGDTQSSSASSASESAAAADESAEVIWNGDGSMPFFVTKQTSSIDAFTFDEPEGDWQKETTDNYVRYYKTGSSGLQAEIFISQCNEDHAKTKGDMHRLCGNARSTYYGGFLYDCDAESSNAKNVNIDGCPATTEDATITGNPNFGSCKGSMLAVGAADASLTAGLVASDAAYDECKASFDQLVSSVRISSDQLDKVDALSGSNSPSSSGTTGSSSATGTSSSATSSQGAYGEGTYKVGVDIPAGEYKLTATGTSKGYWKVTNTSAADADIVGNDNFSGSTYVTVTDGQYLTLERCSAILAE